MDRFNVGFCVDPQNWDEKLVLHENEEGRHVIHGFVMNVSKYSTDERNEIKKYLSDRGVRITEKQATVSTDKTKAGDLSFRVSDPKSIFHLYSNVWQFACCGSELRDYANSQEPKSFNGRTIVEPYSEYVKRQADLDAEYKRKEEDEKIKASIEEMLKNPEKRGLLLDFLASVESKKSNQDERKNGSFKIADILRARQGKV